MANNIRNYDGTYKVLRNVSNPIMFIEGLPLNLALIYSMGGLFFPVILGLILNAVGISLIAVIAIPVSIAALVIGGVKIFYKRFGINGFQLQQRDMSLPTQIEGDMSLQSILKEKLSKVK